MKKAIILLLVLLPLLAYGQQQLTDSQLDTIQCQARITDRDVTIEKMRRRIVELEAKYEPKKDNEIR